MHDGLGVDMDDTSLLFTETITTPSGQPVILDWTLGNRYCLSDKSCLQVRFDRSMLGLLASFVMERSPVHDSNEEKRVGFLLPVVMTRTLDAMFILRQHAMSGWHSNLLSSSLVPGYAKELHELIYRLHEDKIASKNRTG